MPRNPPNHLLCLYIEEMLPGRTPLKHLQQSQLMALVVVALMTTKMGDG